jgi:hypothetical protein
MKAPGLQVAPQVGAIQMQVETVQVEAVWQVAGVVAQQPLGKAQVLHKIHQVATAARV